MKTFFRYPEDSPFREKRLAFQTQAVEVRQEPVSPDAPQLKTETTLKGVNGALASPDVRTEVQNRMVGLSAQRRVNTVSAAAQDPAMCAAMRQKLESRVTV